MESLGVPNIKINGVTQSKTNQDVCFLPRYASHSVVDIERSHSDQILWNKFSNKKNHDRCQQKIDITQVFRTAKLFSKNDTITQSPLVRNKQLSEQYDSQIYIKRQEQQRGRSYKIRGSYYYYLIADQNTKQKGVVVVSDGNFGTASAIVSGMHKIRSVIFLPTLTDQKLVEEIQLEGGKLVEVILKGNDFQQCLQAAQEYAKQSNMVLLHPHANQKLMIGYATIANEILQGSKDMNFDLVLVPCGGGALVSSIASFFKQVSPDTKIIAVEPQVCKPFSTSILQGKIISSQKTSSFCNGSSVKSIGEICYQIGKSSVDGFIAVTQDKVAQKMIKLYSMGIISEPSGALGIAGLDKIRHLIKNKKVLCLLSGANTNLNRFEQARQMNVKSKGYKNFYMINIPNKKGILYNLIVNCFKKTDVVTIRYSKNNKKHSTQALLAIQSLTQDDVEDFIAKMNDSGVPYENITQKDQLIELFF